MGFDSNQNPDAAPNDAPYIVVSTDADLTNEQLVSATAVTDLGVGSLADGEFLQNSSGSLAGGSAGGGIITDETVVRMSRSSQSSSTTAATAINIVDTTDEDNLGEVTNQQFTPDETGDYLVIAYPSFFTTGTGPCRTHVFDVDASEVVVERLEHINHSTDSFVHVMDVRLTSGTTYEIQTQNDSNDYQLQPNSQVVIKRSPVE